MASFADGEGNSSDENNSNSDASNPDTDAMLKTETASIVRQFVYDRFEEEIEANDAENHDEIPVFETARPDALEELRSIRQENDPDSTAVRVSRRLREIGDEIQTKYQDEFHDMINQLNLNVDECVQVFLGGGPTVVQEWHHLASDRRLAVFRLRDREARVEKWTGRHLHEENLSVDCGFYCERKDSGVDCPAWWLGKTPFVYI